MQTLKEFISAWEGKKTGNTPENMGECVGLSMMWVANLGLAHIWGNAKDLFANATETDYIKIKNSDTVFVEAGDIVVWNGRMGGGYGHTAIATGKNSGDSFEVFEQNNPLGSVCRLHTYANYTNVTGWLRPKVLPVDNEVMNDLQEKLNKYFNREVTANDVTSFIEERKREIDKLNSVINEKDKVISTLSQQLLESRQSLAEASQRADDNLKKYEKAEELRVKYFDLYKSYKLNYEGANETIAKLSKRVTELSKKNELTVGQLLVRLWDRVRGAKI